MNRFEQRRDRLRKLVRKAGGDAILITNFVNVTYLSGFTGDDSYLLVAGDTAVMISDSRYSQQLEEECPGLSLKIRGTGTGQTMMDSTAKVVGQAKVKHLAVEAKSLTLATYERLQDKLARVTLRPTAGLVEQLREIKDQEEIAATRRAVEQAERAFAVIRASLCGDQTERQVAFEIENQIRRFGGSGCSFSPIVAVGPRAALPHAVPTERRIEESPFVLIDWGANEGLYMSDLTRVLATARISPKLERIYGVVLKAQRQAITAIKPGVSMSDVDAVARKVIEDAGHGKHFGHSLGHGLGLEIHELPRLAGGQSAPLQAGMIVTVEPGIYLPNWGGVRIEDDVLVTRTGHEVLTHVPKELADCVVG